jgi:N-acetylglucosamine malate deacetylase 2
MSLQLDQPGKSNQLTDRLLGRDLSSLRILVVAAHPDDETIGASALLGGCPDSNVAYLTDGAPRDSSLWTGGPYTSRDDYARTRRDEAVRALSIAGVSESQIHWLGVADQEAIFQVQELVLKLSDLLTSRAQDLVITHPYEGGHPDHDAAALVCRLAVDRFDPQLRTRLVEMTSYHARDRVCVTGEFLPRHAEDICASLVLQLSEQDRERKKTMLEAYVSQRLVLQSFRINRELLRPAPDYDFSQPPHEGRLWYECMKWPMTGKHWRELAEAAIATPQEHTCR